MKIETRRWLTDPCHNIRLPKTTVTIRHRATVCSVTLDGHQTRKEAIRRTFDLFVRSGEWSREFLSQFRNYAR